MRTLKIKNFLLLGLMILLIGFCSNCKGIKNIFGIDSDEEEYAYNVEVIYERDTSLEEASYDYKFLNIEPAEPVGHWVYEHWQTLQNVVANEIEENKYKYIAEKLPANTRLYVVANEAVFTGRTFIINGVELTEIGKDPLNNPGTVAYFKIKPDGTVIP